MAYDIALNRNTHDLVVHNDLLLIDNLERVVQQVKITLLEWQGEWFLDVRNGVPYLEYILVKNPNLKHIRQILKEKILSVEGVQKITSMELNFNRQERFLTVSYIAISDYGEVVGKDVLGFGNR